MSSEVPFRVANRTIKSVNIFFVTSPFGLFVLIANPKVVVVVTHTINSKNKIKLKWSMVNLKNNVLNKLMIVKETVLR